MSPEKLRVWELGPQGDNARRADVRSLLGTSPLDPVVPINLILVRLWDDSVVSMHSHNAHQAGGN